MRVLLRNPPVGLCLAGLAALTLAGSGCARPKAKPGAPAPPQAAESPNHLFDPLMKGDLIEIDLRGTPLEVRPSKQEIKQDGTVSLENIPNALQASGLTPGQLEQEIYTNYVPAIYKHLDVHVTALQRYFYVGGQVHNTGGGGRQPYSGPMTVTRAIQAAGDFTDFADQRHVRLIRMNGSTEIIDCHDVLRHQAPDPPVGPGDQIYVPMRRL